MVGVCSIGFFLVFFVFFFCFFFGELKGGQEQHKHSTSEG